MTDVNVSGNNPPSVSVSGNTVSVSVSSGVGPQGPAGPAGAGGVTSINALTGTLTVSAGANVTVTTGTAGLTISSASGGGSSAWNDITGKPDLVNSVAGRTGTVTLTTADLSDFATAAAKYGPVTSVAGRTGSVTLSSSDVSGLATVATSGKYTDLTGTPTLATIATSGSASDLGSGTVPTARLSVATTTAVGVISSSSGLSITSGGALSADVRSVAGRTGAVTISSGDVSGLASIATSGSASDLSAGTVPTARLPVATTTAVGGVIVGTGLAVSSGTVAVTYGTTTGTACQGNDSRLTVYNRLSDTVSNVSYLGRAPTGSATSSSVWRIKKTTISAAGSVSSSLTALNVKWDDRLTATYS